MKTTSKLGADQIADAIERSYGGLDNIRGSAVRGLLRIREAKTNSRRRDLENAQKSGDTDAVRRYTAMVAAGQQMIAVLRRDAEISATKIPERKHDAVIVYGQVARQNKAQVDPVTSARVAVFDQTQEAMGKQLAVTTTDNQGHFKLEVPIAGQVTDSQNVRLGYVAAFDQNGQKVLAARTIPLLAGSLSYRDLLITGDSAQEWTVDTSKPQAPTEDRVCAADEWVVRGRVTDDGGTGLPDLIVTVHDKDFLFDDRLGQAKTDQNGYYSLSYRTEDFRDLIERKPDIYIDVMNKEGRQLYTSKRAIRYEAGRVEIINAVISSPK